MSDITLQILVRVQCEIRAEGKGVPQLSTSTLKTKASFFKEQSGGSKKNLESFCLNQLDSNFQAGHHCVNVLLLSEIVGLDKGGRKRVGGTQSDHTSRLWPGNRWGKQEPTLTLNNLSKVGARVKVSFPT